MFSFTFNYRNSSKAPPPPPPRPRWLIYCKPICGGGGGGLIAIVSVVHKELEYKVEKLKNEMGGGPVSK